LGVAACAVLYHGPALEQPPQYSKRARVATIPLNAASSEGIPFACIMAAAISADVSGLDVIRRASCVICAKYLVRR
jgi:hypothetical protein